MGALSPFPRLYFRDPVTDEPLDGGKVFTYLANTLTPQATYTTAAESVAHANPIILDSAGSATVFLDGSTTYDFVVKRSDDTTVYTVDDVFAADAAYIQGLVNTAVAGIVIGAATTSAAGIVELATSAEAIAGTDTARAVTPAALAALFDIDTDGGEISILGWRVKYGTLTDINTGNTAGADGVTGSSRNTTVTFATPFPNACTAVLLAPMGDNGTGGQESSEHSFSVDSSSATQFVCKAYRICGSNTGSEGYKVGWVAVGK